MMKKILCCMIGCLLLCSHALAEQAKVQTPGGWLNMRAKPSTKADPLKQVPNHATVTYLEQTDEEWSRITYQGVTGYVQTHFLNLNRTAEGKELYPDGNGAVYVRKTPSDDGSILAVLSTNQPLTILKVEDDWTKVTCTDWEGNEVTGYILTKRIEDQFTTPQQTTSYYNVTGITASQQALYEHPSKSSEKLATLHQGMEIKVLYTEGSWCKVQVDSIYTGYVPAQSLQITGDSIKEPVSPLISYHATYFLCTVPSGSLPTYAEPTGNLTGNLKNTFSIDPGEKLPVVQKAYQSHGMAWAQVIWKGRTYWTPASAISVSKETGTMYYSRPIDNFTRGTVYAGSGGATLYAAGSRLSKVLAKIPAGTELDGGLSDRYVRVTYNGQDGYVFYSDVICGLAQYWDDEDHWRYEEHLNDPLPTPAPTPLPSLDETKHISSGKARSFADDALKKAYQVKNIGQMTVKTDKAVSLRGSTDPVYEFAYFKDGKYLYYVLINALTGHTEFTADYTAFAQTVSHEQPKKATPAPMKGELTPSQIRSKADAFLKDQYGGFGNHSYKVESIRYDKMPSYEGPVYRLNYYADDRYAYTCILQAADGKVLYHTDVLDYANTEIDYATPTPEPVYESKVDIGPERARAIADGTLAGKYPDFSSANIVRVSVSYTEAGAGGPFETPYYNLVYYTDGTDFYTCVVHAWTEKILYTDGNLPGEGNG